MQFALLLLLACTGCHFDRDGSQPLNINPWGRAGERVYTTSDHETAMWREIGRARDTSDLRND